MMSLYCCWISRLSKSVGEIVLIVSRLEENTFNLQFRHRNAVRVSACRAVSHSKKAHSTNPGNVCRIKCGILRFRIKMVHFYFNEKQKINK